MPKITVAGTATQSIPSERGTVRLLVSFTGAKRADVVAHAEQSHARVVAQAKAHVTHGAATWWGADQVSVYPFDQWVKPSAQEDQVKVRRFRASADVRVKFRDFGALAAWVSEVALNDGVTVGGVDWTLTEVRRDAAVAQVRAAAAQDSVARATAYAEALGLGTVRLVALYEKGLRPHVGDGGAMPGVAMRAAAAGSSSEGLELRPDDIDVTAEVTADFETGA